MSLTVQQYIDNTRNMMDAASSARWTDVFITTVLGYIFDNEYSSLLAANPYYKLANRAVTCDANGQFLLTALNSGAGDTKQYWGKILALTDGNSVYRQTEFMSVPLATTQNQGLPYMYLYYLAGDNIQVLPVSSGLALNCWVNYMPPRIDQLSAVGVAVDWPDGDESILWNLAAAELLTKGGAETQAAADIRALAASQRQSMYQDLSRRTARPLFMGYSDTASEWYG